MRGCIFAANGSRVLCSIADSYDDNHSMPDSDTMSNHHTVAYSDGDPNYNPNPDSNANHDTYPDFNCDGDCHYDSDSDAMSYSHSHTHGDCNENADTVPDSDADGDTDSDTNSDRDAANIPGLRNKVARTAKWGSRQLQDWRSPNRWRGHTAVWS